MSEISNTQNDPAPETAAEKPSLTLQDLTLMMQILQVATSRGTWKADELSSVGGLYDRVTAFLTAAGVTIQKASENPEVKEADKE